MVKRRRFHGYNIVAACFVIQGITIGGMFAYGVFFGELENEFGWSRATISGASSLSFVILGALGIVAGKLNDRIGPRVLIVVSAVCFSAGYALLSRLEAPWQLFLFYGVLAGIGYSTHDVVTLSTIARWFVRRRGMMTGIAKMGTGTGQVLVPLAVASLIATVGWRSAALAFGVVSLLIVVVAAHVMRRDPQSMGQHPDGIEISNGTAPRGAKETGFTLAEAAVTRQFWILCVTQLAVMFCLMTVMIHIVPHATDLGVEPATAATILSAIGAVSIAGRFTIGTLVDRLGGRRSLMICFVILLASFVLLQSFHAIWMLFVFASVYGFAHGGFFTVMSPTLAEFFGTGSHGVIFGIVLFSGMIGGAVGPLLAGTLFDTSGTYEVVFLILTGMALLGLLMAYALRPMQLHAVVPARESSK